MLRPNPGCPSKVLLDIMDRVTEHGMPVMNMMLHSSELSLDCSPLSKTKDDCARVWNTLEEVFKHTKKIGATCATLSEAAMLLRQKKGGFMPVNKTAKRENKR